jgi:hypothetical protein
MDGRVRSQAGWKTAVVPDGSTSRAFVSFVPGSPAPKRAIFARNATATRSSSTSAPSRVRRSTTRSRFVFVLRPFPLPIVGEIA